MEWNIADLSSSPPWALPLTGFMIALCLFFLYLLGKRDKEELRMVISALFAIGVIYIISYPLNWMLEHNFHLPKLPHLWWLWLLITGIGVGAVGTVVIIKRECRPVETCDGYEVDPEKSHPRHLFEVTWPFWTLGLLCLIVLLAALCFLIWQQLNGGSSITLQKY
jgi:H+/Cl- antiporter ClcA